MKSTNGNRKSSEFPFLGLLDNLLHLIVPRPRLLLSYISFPTPFTITHTLYQTFIVKAQTGTLPLSATNSGTYPATLKPSFEYHFICSKKKETQFEWGRENMDNLHIFLVDSAKCKLFILALFYLFDRSVHDSRTDSLLLICWISCGDIANPRSHLVLKFDV